MDNAIDCREFVPGPAGRYGPTTTLGTGPGAGRSMTSDHGSTGAPL